MGIANGFHIFCMNSIASCAENGADAPAGLLDWSLMVPPQPHTTVPYGQTRTRALISCAMTNPGATLIEQLAQVVGDAHVLTGAADVEPYVVDWRGRYHGAARAVVRPANTAQVAAVVKLCAD